MIVRLYWVLRAMLLTLYRHKFGKNWREIEIQGSIDPLIKAPDSYCYPYYFFNKIKGATKEIYLRSDAFVKFWKAKKYVKDKYGLDLIIYDGYRPYEVQEYLFWLYMRDFTLEKHKSYLNQIYGFLIGIVNIEDFKVQFKKTIPFEVQEKLFSANRSYVSFPSKTFPPSPHITGGAIDPWLYKNGKPVELGCPFDHMQKDAGAFYLFLRPWKLLFNKKNRIIAKNRNIMIEAMTRAGFAAYGPEFWHYSYGDQMWSLVYNKPMAIYEGKEHNVEDKVLEDKPFLKALSS